MRWQHGLAMACKPMHFGIILEVLAANPSRLTPPGLWQKVAEKIHAAAAVSDPLRRLHALRYDAQGRHVTSRVEGSFAQQCRSATAGPKVEASGPEPRGSTQKPVRVE